LPQTRARIIIGNLLRNALQYSDEGVVEIVVRDRSLLISNPIGAAQGTDESMAFGYGLGLDLVQRLCQKSGWRLHYSSDEQRFRCELLFPATPD
ncbi:ATP-binding protein, partial [Pseudomonas aeruginosa]